MVKRKSFLVNYHKHILNYFYLALLCSVSKCYLMFCILKEFKDKSIEKSNILILKVSFYFRISFTKM